MVTHKKLLLATCVTLLIIHIVESQNQQGFISLLCGLPSEESPFKEPLTNLTYVSDVNYIKEGQTAKIQSDLIGSPKVLRYFLDGIRNCYSISVTQDTSFLIRATFHYGNYDGLNNPPRFDIYLGPNFWATVDLRKSGDLSYEEIIHLTRSSLVEVCLVKTGATAPIISAVELRPLPYDTYTAHSNSLRYFNRLYITDLKNVIRYPQDIHERIWMPYLKQEWTHTNTTINVKDFSDGYNLPQNVVRTGAMPTNVSDAMTITWQLETAGDHARGYFYIADITESSINDTREFKIVANDEVLFDTYNPAKFEVQTVFNTVPLTCEGGVCRVQLVRTPRSTLPPVMNALEIYTIVEFPQYETDINEVVAVRSIQSTYGLNRTSWQGDPCVPLQFMWTGLRCRIVNMSTPRIVTLDLSSSGLSGAIASIIQNLTQLKKLDLSENNLTGEVPEFLAKMKSLMFINLSGNNFSGFVAQALPNRKKDGLKLLVDENVKKCVSCHKKFPILVVVVASVSSLAAIIIIVLVLIFFLKRRKT